MRRFQMFFPSEILEKVRRIARRTGASVAQVVREAVVEFIKRDGGSKH